MKFFTKMKVVLLTLMITVPTAGSFGYAATLVWDSSNGVVEGYRVHYGTQPSSPSVSVDVGNNTQYNLEPLPLQENRSYYFCVTAYNSAGESPPCPEVVFTPGDNTPPVPPVSLTVH